MSGAEILAHVVCEVVAAALSTEGKVSVRFEQDGAAGHAFHFDFDRSVAAKFYVGARFVLRLVDGQLPDTMSSQESFNRAYAHIATARDLKVQPCLMACTVGLCVRGKGHDGPHIVRRSELDKFGDVLAVWDDGESVQTP